jgi:hypothetical protein
MLTGRIPFRLFIPYKPVMEKIYTPLARQLVLRKTTFEFLCDLSLGAKNSKKC